MWTVLKRRVKFCDAQRVYLLLWYVNLLPLFKSLETSHVLHFLLQAAAQRSKTVLIVKHLPAETKAEELQELFEKHGVVSQVLVPPSGLTAIVEYMDPAEASKGFRALCFEKVRLM